MVTGKSWNVLGFMQLQFSLLLVIPLDSRVILAVNQINKYRLDFHFRRLSFLSPISNANKDNFFATLERWIVAHFCLIYLKLGRFSGVNEGASSGVTVGLVLSLIPSSWGNQ